MLIEYKALHHFFDNAVELIMILNGSCLHECVDLSLCVTPMKQQLAIFFA